VSVFLYDTETDTLKLEASTNASGRAREASHVQFPMSIRDNLISQVARERQAVVVNDVLQSDAYVADPDLPETRSEMALPMLVGQHLVGVLDLQSQMANRFSHEDQHILTTLAEQVAIAVRNAQLFEETKAARQAAEEANETKSRFLANMSHELRTPLNAILNFTAFVADGVLGPVNGEQEDVLQEALASGKHLLSLINDVLDITKIEAGMMDLFVEELDFNVVLASVVSVGKGLVKDKPVKLVAEIEEGLPKSFGDKRRLRQVFLNLLSNAAKFTSEGQIMITAQRCDDGVEVVVSDTGIGIAPDEHHKVFESFKQAKHDLAGAVGTGLGMPISKYFVEIHSGRIWFESEPGEGTTFYVRLPSLSQDEAESINELVTVESAA
jgi:signal transduction histidine kinase